MNGTNLLLKILIFCSEKQASASDWGKTESMIVVFLVSKK